MFRGLQRILEGALSRYSGSTQDPRVCQNALVAMHHQTAHKKQAQDCMAAAFLL